MHKIVVTALATLGVLGLAYYFFGNRLTTTAVDVPSTSHSPAFGITWLLIAGVAGVVVCYRWSKSK